MSKGDIINACFELLGGVLQWINVRRLLRDKKVAGVDWRVTGFHVGWGVWNMWFYQDLKAPMSAVAAAFLCAANACWIYLAIKYSREEKLRADMAAVDHHELLGYEVATDDENHDYVWRIEDGRVGRCKTLQGAVDEAREARKNWRH